MAKQYVFIRMRKEDYEKMINTKKIPMQQDLKLITGKNIEIKITQLMNIAANATWDLGSNFKNKIIGAVRIKKSDLKL